MREILRFAQNDNAEIVHHVKRDLGGFYIPASFV